MITTKENEAIVKEIMASEITKWMGVSPKVVSKNLLPPSILPIQNEHVKKAEFENNAIVIKPTKIVDTCTGEEFSSEMEAAMVKDISYDTLILYLNSEENPTCLRYKAA